MFRRSLIAVLWTTLCLVSRPAAAQDKPFIFSVTTATDTERPQARVDYEVGVGERAFQSSPDYQPEQRVNVQASLGRFTLLGRFGIADTGSAYQSSQAAEVLVALAPPSRRFTLAAGGGVQHEAEGVNVLVSRVVVGTAAGAWTSQGNVILQHALSPGRDPLDLLLTAGVARRIASRASLGVEGIGEDLEGFWDAAEAEGGARLLIGPSLHVWSPGRTWQFLCAAGPTLHPRGNGRSSDALRDLPPTDRRVGYAVQAGLSVTLGK
jgi:hypothetical protein